MVSATTLGQCTSGLTLELYVLKTLGFWDIHVIKMYNPRYLHQVSAENSQFSGLYLVAQAINI